VSRPVVPSGDTLQARFADRLTRAPQSRALAFYKAGRDVEWRSFADFHERAATVAAGLVERGLEVGDVCVIVLPSGEQSAVTLMAALLAGAKPLLVAPPALLGADSDLPKVVRSTVERTGARIAVLPASQRDDVSFADLSATTRFLYSDEDIAGTASLPDLGLLGPDDVAALQLTSGTTGLPKICVWTQRAVLAALDGMTEAMELTPSDVCFNWTPLYHDMGLVNNFLTCMSGNVPLVMMSPHDFVKRPSDWLKGLQETGATVTWSPNFGFALVTQRTPSGRLDGVRLDHVRGFWNAAERIHARTYAEFAQAFEPLGVRPEALKTNFGCAENIGGATFTRPGEAYAVEHVDAVRFRLEGVAVPADPARAQTISFVGAGKGHPRLDIAILDEEGEVVGDGVVGAVALRTPSRMEGYLADEAATSEAIQGDLLVTGDLGYVRHGELFWVGRALERITVRGKKIDPSDFEPVLFDVAGLRQGCFAAFGIEDEEAGTEEIVLVSEVRDESDLDIDEVVSQVRRQVLSRMGLALADVVLVSPGTLTKTSSGKRRHRHSKEMYRAGAFDADTLARAG
jgi:acyl-CoA synthetase (AMP-forming)/AMP-acid ligase II